ncbi:MAG: glycoside hydrolase/phage tail family protein, partial [Pseudomonadota bacterium]
EDWSVAGILRADARLVSQVDGRPSYGGTPSDTAVLRAIEEIKSRGLRVGLNPFILVDIPADNALTDLDGSNGQPTNPWRGRITAKHHSAQSSAQIASGVAAFVGQASQADITATEAGIVHTEILDWGYRRLVLHYARLAQQAGGVDLFLIGSEMRGMTTCGDAQSGYPFVDALVALADDVRTILPTACTVTYGADWSEYFGDQSGGDITYHLDPLWSAASIDAVGIDAYFPISDWRDNADDRTEGRGPYDGDVLFQNLASGEGFDWYYASDADRAARRRTAIQDGLGKPWVYRFKDLQSWWASPHFNRVNGVEAPVASPWVPQSKPIIFTEYGAPAVHMGAGQPNVFFDPQSSESHLPYRSNGGRDDQAQRALLNAYARRYSADHPAHLPATNPLSSVYRAPMVDFGQSQVWAWDARPHPAFPANSDFWSDGGNWWRGHWLNGRMGGLALADLIETICAEAGVHTVDVTRVDGVVDGFVLGATGNARQMLDALLTLFQIVVWEEGGVLIFASPGRDAVHNLSHDGLVYRDDDPLVRTERLARTDLPSRIDVVHLDPARAYQSTTVSHRLSERPTRAHLTLELPIAAAPEVMEVAAVAHLKSLWVGQETISVHIPPSNADVRVGDLVSLYNGSERSRQTLRIDSIEARDSQKLTLRPVEQPSDDAVLPRSAFADGTAVGQQITSGSAIGKPHVIFADLPLLQTGLEKESGTWIAVASKPWIGPHAVLASPGTDDFTIRATAEAPASLGVLLEDLPATAASGRWLKTAALKVRVKNAPFASASSLAVLGGENAVAVQCSNNGWEVLQFSTATLLGPNVWALSGLLRGQAGTERFSKLGAPSGASLIVLNSAIVPLSANDAPRGAALNYLVGPARKVPSETSHTAAIYAPDYRALTPYAPVHLAVAGSAGGGLSVSWVRRDRLDPDDWQRVEIPNSEASLSYRLTVSANGQSLQHVTTREHLDLAPDALAPLALSTGDALAITVQQISDAIGPGDPATASLTWVA